MMRNKQDINAAVEDDDDELLAFLQRFDIEKEYVPSLFTLFAC